MRREPLAVATLAASLLMAGCEVDSFFDPSKTGRFMPEPTMIPILDRIDVIETDDTLWGETTGVMPEDLMPNDLTYLLAPGDYVTVEVFEGVAAEQWRVYSRRIDAAGNFRIAELGDLRAAGRTVQEFEDHVAEEMARLVVTPRVHVHVEEGVAFTYTIHGHLNQPGLYMLRKADLRLNEALASVGGVPPNAERVFVVRQVRLTEDILPAYERDGRTPGRTMPPTPRDERRPPADIEDLIDQLEDPPQAQPGMLGTHRRGLIDVDDLTPVRLSERRVQNPRELRRIAGDLQRVTDQTPPEPPADETYIYIEERGEWVRVERERAREQQPAAQNNDFEGRANRRQPPIREIPGVDEPMPRENDQPRLITERVIEIPFERLLVDSSYDIVVRPNDRIYVEGPRLGLVYISGEIARPGVYEMPHTGRLTLSRLVAAAGDLGPIAQPERVDLTRMVGPDREATLRLDLAAIRRRTEPDIVIKPNDHIIIGTSWVATPLAVIRNGFRATYGFGFLLDRNFGNDVFGAPPSRLGQ